MTTRRDEPPITPALLLEAYGAGYFPMAMTARGRKLYWFNPDMRAVLKPEELHISRSLARQLRRHAYTVTFDTAFGRVIGECAAARSTARDDTWINKEIIALYTGLHKMGFAHSVEVWEGEALVGGLYGVSLGGAFFGESMFSKRTGTSKIALVHLVRRLTEAGYQLLDAQFENPHLVQFGFQGVPAEDYQSMLRQALNARPNPSERFGGSA